MMVIAVFIVFAGLLDTVAVGICTLVERYSEHASLLAFLAFFVVDFVIAWQVAVFVVERFFLSDEQRKKNEEHVKWVSSLSRR